MKLDNLKKLKIAHRGIHGNGIVENTLEAFSLALDKKVPIEFDLHILKDGKIVVFHDDNLKRLTGVNRNIFSYNYDELKQLKLSNTNSYIPLFEEVLDLIKGKVLIVIEVKRVKGMSYVKFCEKIISILKEYPYDFVIKSFDIRIVKWFLKNTNYITGLLIANRKGSFYDWLMRQKLTISLLCPDFISVDYQIVSNKMIQNFREKKPVLVWTIRDIDTLNKVKDQADSYLIEKFYF